ncbi:MAG: hypothetical protein Q4P11_07415 [Methanobrevibacter sp.]|nr:hypothetical protein [Methanobrevibacter sp.]
MINKNKDKKEFKEEDIVLMEIIPFMTRKKKQQKKAGENYSRTD